MEQAKGSTTELVRGGLTEADDMSCSAHSAGTFRAAGGPRKPSGVRAPWPARHATCQRCVHSRLQLKHQWVMLRALLIQCYCLAFIGMCLHHWQAVKTARNACLDHRKPGIPSEERGVWCGWWLGVRFMRACWKGLMPREAPAPEKRAGLTRFGSCRQYHLSVGSLQALHAIPGQLQSLLNASAERSSRAGKGV